MRKKLQVLIITLFLLSSNTTYGNKTKQIKAVSQPTASPKTNANIERVKRSLQDVDTPSWFNQGIAPEELVIRAIPKYQNDLSSVGELPKQYFSDVQEPYNFKPVGIFNSDSTEVGDFGENLPKFLKFLPKDRRDDPVTPFWGNRGRRSSEEEEPFWGNRGRRQSEEDPFWGTRGRREDDEPFWGNRGRREEEPFWGNRGRREEDPFWGNRGRREADPFSSTRGRREEDEPFWGNRGRRLESALFQDGIDKERMKDSIKGAIRNLESDVKDQSKLKSDKLAAGQNTVFWKNRLRDSKLKHLFDNSKRNRKYSARSIQQSTKTSKIDDANTLHDSRFFVDEPSFIVVERVGRSSGEDDPYFISRGKKKTSDVLKSDRERRNAFEDLVKSVRNDPYYIARGKKKNDDGNNVKSSSELGKAKELICSTTYLSLNNNVGNKMKRDVNENERDRRTTLKKLQAQLQIDPYFVSRGKKSDASAKNYENIEDFINHVNAMCSNM